MTTPQPPAGLYPDPDGSGGQRYRDGYTWTDSRVPAPQLPPPPPPAPPRTPERVGGAHRAPEPEPEPEPPALPTTPVGPPATPVGGAEDSTPAAKPVEESASSSGFEPTNAIPTSPPPSSPPPFSDAPAGSAGIDRPLLMRYLAVCGALLAAAVAVGVYAAFFTDDGSSTIHASDDPATSQTSTQANPATTDDTPTETATDTPTEEPAPTETGDPTDGAFAYSVHGVEVGTTVTSADAPVEKTAVGEYVVVHMTVTNVGDAATPFLGTFQKLLAGGTVYSIDDEATFYLGGGMAELNPGDQVDVSVAFDVPPGTTPEAIELHTDPLSPGIQVPLA